MNSIKDNFFVITGGPGGGKSTLLNALGARGFKYVSETGRFIIQERLRKGLSPRPEPEEFAIQLFRMDHENYIRNLSQPDVLFFDRSYLDSAALIHETNRLYFEKIKHIINTHRFNNKIFVTPPWKEIYRNDNERDQTFEESINIYEKLCDWYELNGYELVVIPKVSIEKRVDFILNEINEH